MEHWRLRIENIFYVDKTLLDSKVINDNLLHKALAVVNIEKAIEHLNSIAFSYSSIFYEPFVFCLKH